MDACLFFCLFVCQQLQAKTTDRIFVKILPEMHLWTRWNSLNFGSYPLLNPNIGFFRVSALRDDCFLCHQTDQRKLTAYLPKSEGRMPKIILYNLFVML